MKIEWTKTDHADNEVDSEGQVRATGRKGG